MSEKNKNLEAIISEIENICNTLEKEKLPIDETLQKFEQGIHLIQKAENQLKNIKTKINSIITNDSKSKETS